MTTGLSRAVSAEPGGVENAYTWGQMMRLRGYDEAEIAELAAKRAKRDRERLGHLR